MPCFVMLQYKRIPPSHPRFPKVPSKPPSLPRIRDARALSCPPPHKRPASQVKHHVRSSRSESSRSVFGQCETLLSPPPPPTSMEPSVRSPLSAAALAKTGRFGSPTLGAYRPNRETTCNCPTPDTLARRGMLGRRRAWHANPNNIDIMAQRSRR
ncbi:uncharacterized protein J3D65DRAFT_222186 [Phyllosticta citribraziliensis]|uniref:Uncharacterized protein n=1 Tax=Phyllosticta citribraziliensis TaxID=989973 RepID=A0ABR1M4T7_9PEZI